MVRSSEPFCRFCPARRRSPSRHRGRWGALDAWEGDDDHVIFWMLSLTPTQRLAALQGFVDSFMALQNDRPAQV